MPIFWATMTRRVNQIHRVSSSIIAGKIQCRCAADPRVADSITGRENQINRVICSVEADKIQCHYAADPMVAGSSSSRWN